MTFRDFITPECFHDWSPQGAERQYCTICGLDPLERMHTLQELGQAFMSGLRGEECLFEPTRVTNMVVYGGRVDVTAAGDSERVYMETAFYGREERLCLNNCFAFSWPLLVVFSAAA